jgi:hypothetical protein
MKYLFLIFITICQSFAAHPDLKGFKSKFGVGFDNTVKYDRLLPLGFQIGTEWRYRIVGRGGEYFSLDQQPEFWLLTTTHCFLTKFMDWENRINALGPDIDFTSVEFVSRLRKQIVFDGRWALSPFVQVVDYSFDGSALGADWPESESMHHFEFGTKLGLDLEVFF